MNLTVRASMRMLIKERNVKRTIVSSLAALSISAASAAAFAADGITVTLDGKAIDFDVQPQIIDERTMVPLRAIFEALGAEVGWEQETETVTAVKGDTTIVMTIGSDVFYVNQKPVELDVAPVIIDERTLVPVRAIAESFGLKVDWNGDAQTVIINSAADKAANAAYTKLIDSIKSMAVYDEEKSAYSINPDVIKMKLPGLTGTDMTVKYNASEQRVYFIIGKTAANGMKAELALSIESDGAPRMSVSLLSGDEIQYSVAGTFKDGEFCQETSNVDKELYDCLMQVFEEACPLTDKFLSVANVGVSLSDLGIGA